MLTYLQWYETALNYSRKHRKELRRGQAMFNSLSDHQPKLACQLGGTSLDPFYRDEVLHNFLDEVEDQWGRYDTAAVRQPEFNNTQKELSMLNDLDCTGNEDTGEYVECGPVPFDMIAGLIDTAL